MARPRKKNPDYRLHKATGQAVVTLSDPRTGKRRDFYLGPHGSPASHERYAALLREFEQQGQVVDDKSTVLPPQNTVNTVSSLFVDYLRDQKTRHGIRDGEKLRGHLYELRSALRLCRGQAGLLPVNHFGPLLLQEVRGAMIQQGWKRETINRAIRRIIGAFRWGVSRERVDPQTLARLQSLEPLRRGEADVPEGKKVQPVPAEQIEAVKPYVSRQVAALIDLQRLTGARAGELVIMRPKDIDASQRVWRYRPETHKNAWRDRTREIPMGPRAQAVLSPFLEGRADDAYVFSPAEAEQERRADQRKRRSAHPSANKTRDARRQADGRTAGTNVGDRYTTDSYRRAIVRACDKAYPPPKNLRGEKLKAWREAHRWTPHRLRHTAATEIRRACGLEEASLILGHSSAVITDAVYAKRDMARVERAILDIG